MDLLLVLFLLSPYLLGTRYVRVQVLCGTYSLKIGGSIRIQLGPPMLTFV